MECEAARGLLALRIPHGGCWTVFVLMIRTAEKWVGSANGNVVQVVEQQTISVGRLLVVSRYRCTDRYNKSGMGSNPFVSTPSNGYDVKVVRG